MNCAEHRERRRRRRLEATATATATAARSVASATAHGAPRGRARSARPRSARQWRASPPDFLTRDCKTSRHDLNSHSRCDQSACASAVAAHSFEERRPRPGDCRGGVARGDERASADRAGDAEIAASVPNEPPDAADGSRLSSEPAWTIPSMDDATDGGQLMSIETIGSSGSPTRGTRSGGKPGGGAARRRCCRRRRRAPSASPPPATRRRSRRRRG